MPVHVLKCSNDSLAVFFFFLFNEFSNSCNLFFFFLGGLENSEVSRLCCLESSGSTWLWWPVATGWRRHWSCSNQLYSLATGRCSSTSSRKTLWSPSLISRWMCGNGGVVLLRADTVHFGKCISWLLMYFCSGLSRVAINSSLGALLFLFIMQGWLHLPYRETIRVLWDDALEALDPELEPLVSLTLFPFGGHVAFSKNLFIYVFWMMNNRCSLNSNDIDVMN